jgi:sulfonate transport system substrate-binding protein
MSLRHVHQAVRRSVLIFSVLAGLALLGCGASEAQPDGAAKLGLDEPLPTTVPEGTKLVIGSPDTQKALELSGEIDKLGFEVEWANMSGGPQTTEAFRADALDVGSVADIPPIHATWTGLDVRIVAAEFRKDPIHHPVYQLGIAPGVKVESLSDLRGKRIAYSPGQAQGALVLRVLQKAGLTKTDVRPIELPSTGDVYPNALANHQVDVAPIGGVNIKRYLAKYGKDGATTIPHGIRDDPGHLYVQTKTLEDPAKAAAIREFVQHWARANRWVYEHPDEWIQGYYVEHEGLTAQDGEYLVEAAGEPDIPARWDEVIARHQQTIDLLAKETGNDPLKAEDLYDRRFESVAADALEGGDQR